MKTNFKHLRKYSRLMGYAVDAEVILVKQGTAREYEDAAMYFRKILEGFISYLFKFYGLEYGEAQTSFERINKLYELDVISKKTKDRMHIIRKNCNPNLHWAEDEEGRKEMIAHGNSLYEEVYPFTYEMTAYYLTDTALRAYKSRRANNNGSRNYYGSANRVYTPAKQYNYNKRPNAYSNNNYSSAGEQIRHYTPVAYNNPVVSGETATNVSAEQISQPNYGGFLTGIFIFVLIVAAAVFVCASM